jgi:hypothetical protein
MGLREPQKGDCQPGVWNLLAVPRSPEIWWKAKMVNVESSLKTPFLKLIFLNINWPRIKKRTFSFIPMIKAGRY